MSASFREIVEAFEIVSTDSGFGENEAVLCRQTGRIYVRFGSAGVDDPDDEMPDDIDDASKYIAIPGKRALDLGKPLVLEFARECLPNDFDEVRYIFGERGAYQKFKALLIRRKALDRWYDFESKATERALRDWCELHSIAVTD